MKYSLEGEHKGFSFIRTFRHYLVIVLGYIVLGIGFLMVIFPGPALVVIPLGLAILATELVWARRWLKIAKKELNVVKKKAKGVFN